MRTTPAPDSQALWNVIAGIQEVGVLNPAAQQELLEHLKQTEPTLWPMVAEEVRAGVTMRRPLGAQEPEGPTCSSPRAPLPCPASPGSEHVSQGRKAVFEHVEDGPAGEVVAVCYDEESPASWQAHLEKAIRALESELDEAPRSEGDVARQARLRMLYLLNDRRDEALRPVDSPSPAMREFWSKQLSALATLTDPASTAECEGRRSEAKEDLAAAVEKLGKSCPLVVENLAFATEIELFGRYRPFDKYEFEPGQKVLLYAELENFESRKTCRGFHTATRSSYQIFDSRGRRVAEHEFAPSEEHCPAPRRDYFIGYEFNLPAGISPGKHVLQLTVADQNSEKIGQATIEFTVRSSDR